jgi:hypothetical protein
MHAKSLSLSLRVVPRKLSRGISIRFCEEHYEEFRRTMKGAASVETMTTTATATT